MAVKKYLTGHQGKKTVIARHDYRLTRKIKLTKEAESRRPQKI